MLARSAASVAASRGPNSGKPCTNDPSLGAASGGAYRSPGCVQSPAGAVASLDWTPPGPDRSSSASGPSQGGADEARSEHMERTWLEVGKDYTSGKDRDRVEAAIEALQWHPPTGEGPMSPVLMLESVVT